MDGVIFLVDAEDKERFPEARQELSVCIYAGRLGIGASFR